MLLSRMQKLVNDGTGVIIKIGYTADVFKMNVDNYVPANVTDRNGIVIALKMAIDSLDAADKLNEVFCILLTFRDNTQSAMKRAVFLSTTKGLAVQAKPKRFFVLASVGKNYVGGGWVVHGTGTAAKAMLSHKQSVVDKITQRANDNIQENEIAEMNEARNHF